MPVGRRVCVEVKHLLPAPVPSLGQHLPCPFVPPCDLLAGTGCNHRPRTLDLDYVFEP